MKRLYYCLFSILLVSRTFAQCPTAPAACTYVATAATPASLTATITLTGTQTFCVQSGNFTGSVNGIPSGTRVYVAAGASFNPASVGDIGGTLENCGTASLPTFNIAAGGATISNYGTMTFKSGIGPNNPSTWLNGLDSKMYFLTGLILDRATMTNNGFMQLNASFTMNGANSVLINHDTLITTGQITTNGLIDNDGYMFAKGSDMTLNAGGTITNGCYFVADGSFTYNGNSPLNVTGFIWSTGLSSGNTIKIQGNGGLYLSGDAFIQGINFENSKNIYGKGNLRFTGTTTTQGGNFGTDGTAANHLNFYDASPTGTQIFDVQSSTIGAFVSKNFIGAQDGSSLPLTCSPLIRRCNVKPIAGSDRTICSVNTVDLPDALTGSKQKWTIVSKPAAATVAIGKFNGQATGLTVNGLYTFALTDTFSLSCSDTVIINRGTTPPVPKITSPLYYCQGVAGTLPDSATYVWYTASSGGTGVSPAPALSTSSAGTFTYYVSRNVGGCESARVRLDLTINAKPSTTSTVTGSTVCASSSSAIVTVVGTKLGESYQAFEGATPIGSPVVSDASGTVILTLPIGQTAGKLDSTVLSHTISVVASISGCSNVTLPNTTVIINRTPNAALTVTGSTVCASSPNATVTVTGTRSGESYQAYEGTTAIGTAVVSTGGVVTLILPLGQTSGRLDTTVKYHAIKLTAAISGCSKIVSLTDTGTVIINRTPDATLTVSGSTVCASSPNATVTVTGTRTGEIYQAYEGTTAIGIATTSTGGTVILTLPLGQTLGRLDTTVKYHSIRLTATVSGCSKVVSLTDTGTVIINRTPNAGLTVSGSTVCASSPNATVTVTGTRTGEIYQAYEGTTAIGTSVTSTGGTVILTLPLGQTLGRLDTTVKYHTIKLTAAISGCSKIVSLTDTGTVIINRTPDATLTVSGSTVCASSPSATVTVIGTRSGEIYQAYEGSTAIGAAVTSMGGNVVITLPLGQTSGRLDTTVKYHTIKLTATVSGCGKIVSLTDTGTVIINRTPNAGLAISGSTVCASSSNATVTISGTKAGEVYQALEGATPIGSPVASAGGLVTLILPLGKTVGRLDSTVSTHTIAVTATISGCTAVKLTSVATVIINRTPNRNLTVTATGPICAGGSSTITISGSEIGVKYKIYDGTSGNVLLDSIMGTGSAINKAVSLPTAGLRTIIVRAEIGGCAIVTLVSQPTVQVNNGPNVGLTVTATNPICFGDTSRLKITNAQSGVTYQVFDGSGPSLTASVAGANADLNFNIVGLAIGTHTLVVKATTGGCGTVELTQKPVVIVNGKPTDTNLILRGDTVCSNSDSASVVIFNTERGVSYQAILGASALIGAPKVSPSANATVVLRLPVSALALGANIISIRGTIGGCGTINFTKTATVLKNKLPSIATLTLVGDTICQNTDSAYVRVGNTEVGVRYQSVIKGVFVGSIKTSTANGSSVVLGIPRSALQLGVNGVRISAKIGGCADATTTDSTIVIVNILPDANLSVVGDTVCSNSSTADFIIKNTKKGEIFQAYWKKTAIGLAKTSPADGANVSLDIPVATLGVGTHFIHATASIGGCATISLKDSARVIVNQLPGNNPTIVGDTICSDSVLAVIRLSNTQAGVRYTAYKGGLPVGTAVATGTSLAISINATGFKVGSNLLDLTASISGCVSVNIVGKANVVVNPRPRYDLDFTTTGPVCVGGLSAISIIGSEKGVIYTVLDNGLPIDTILGKGVTVSKQVSMQNVGLRTITIRARINGCSEGQLNGSKTVQVNTGSDTKLNVTATSPVCEGSPIKVTIPNTDPTATYKVVVNSLVVSDSLKGTGGTIVLTIDSLPAATYTLTIRANTLGCGVFELEKKPIVRVDPKLDANLKVGGDTVCSNSTVAYISVEGTRVSQIYSAYLNGTFLNKDTVEVAGRFVFSVPVNLLAKGPNKINLIASVEGCGQKALRDSALVIVNELPDLNLKVKGDTVCRNSAFATVTVYQTKKGERYQVFLNNASLGKDTLSNGGTFVISVPTSTLPIGLSKMILRSTIDGCGSVQLKDSASILVNPIPDGGLSVSDDTVCVNSLTASVTITGTKATEIYIAYLNGVPLDTVTSVSTQVTLTLPVSKLSIGLNKVSVSAAIKGCATVNLLDSARVLVNELPSDALDVIGDTVCGGADFVDVTVKGTRKGETYQAHKDSQTLGAAVLSNGGDVVLKVPVLGTLEKGVHKIWVSASIRGCAVVNLKDSADVLINDAPQPTLDVIGDTVCSNSTTATVRILGTKIGEAYTALLNSIAISDTVLSTGGTVTLTIPVSKLTLDTNIIQVRTSVPGCGNTLLAKSARVIVNQLPTDSLKVEGDTVCSDATTATVKILKSSKNVVYTPYLGPTSLGQPVVGTGNDIELIISVTLLQEGGNKVSFLASIDGCANVYLKDSASVIKNKKPSITLSLTGSTVCSTADTATVTILGTEKDALYQALINGGTSVGRSVRGTGGDILLKLPVKDLSLDTNRVSVNVGIEGCGIQTLDRQALVIINKLPSDTLSTDGSTVCQSETTATVKVYNTQKNVGYEAYLNNVSVGSVVIGTGGTIELPVTVNKLALGDNKIVVKTSLEQCNIITLKDTAIVKVNKSPDVNAVIVDGTSICPSETALVILSNTQSDVTYHLIVNDQTTSLSIKGTGGPDTIRVSSGLSAGINPVRFTASIQSCSVVDVLDRDTIFVLSDPGFGILGSDLLCYNGIGKYKTTGIAGALGYVWTVQGDSGTVIPSLTSDSLKVQYDTRNGYISVVPIGINGKCDAIRANHATLVKAPITGNVSISGKDTVCINETDTLRVINQRGVGFYNWIFPVDVRILDTIGVYTDSTSDSIAVRYTQSGFRTIRAVPYSQCARAFGDTITKTVRVLGQPIAVANDVSSSDDVIRAITLNLNGVGSTETGSGDADTVQYKWSLENRAIAEITNPTKLHEATITPTVEETKVYLTVTNVNGYCPAKDSAIVKVTFGIDLPNVFSPNNDGVHDKWEIRNLSILFPNAIVEVYNKWGSLVWKSQPGYREAWDGTRNGEELPVATYYFTLDWKNGDKPKVGPITIIR